MNKKFKNTAIALALSACMAFSIIGFTACEGTPGKSAYDIWLEQGNEGSEQDFLESLKGTPGKAPEITVGENGNWFVDGVDTHHKAQGESGTTPEITVGSNGNWFVNGVDTNQKAQGNTPEITVGNNGNWFVNGVDTNQKAQGNTPEIKDGYWWIGDTNTNVKAEGTTGNRGNKITHGEGAPTVTEGANEGDMYVDTKEWNVYFFEGSEWIDYGSIKGKDGSDPKPTPAGTEIDIAADGQQEIDVTLSEGFHIIKADLGTTTLTTGKLYAKVGEIDSELVLSETRSEAAGGNKIYYGYVDIKADTTKITISAKGEAVKGSISFEDYVQPTLKADGQPIEVPVNLNAVGTTGTGALKLKLDSSIVAGDYLVKITNTAEASHLITIGSIGLQIGDRMFTFTKRTYEGTGSSLSPTADNITNANGECWLYCPATNAPSPAIFPITITVTVKTA